jgi:hypothetical protein
MKSVGKMVDAAGIEPATPAMSRQGSLVATIVNRRSMTVEMLQCSLHVPGLSQPEVQSEPWITVLHGGCCPALALWILGQADMARQAAAECAA